MKKKKKGFTLVELLVVIAILAILATVSVVGYLSFTNKAKQSADEQAVTQMNIALEAQEAIDAPENVEEAKDVLEEAGFNVSDYVPLNKDNIFYYDEDEVKVLIYNQVEQKVTFPENLAKTYASFTGGNKAGSWYVLNDKTYEWVSIDNYTGLNDTVKLTNALKDCTDYEIVRLNRDVTVVNAAWSDDLYTSYSFPSNDKGNARIDLNNNTLNVTSSLVIGASTGMGLNTKYYPQNIYISNGNIHSTVSGVNSFNIDRESTLTLSNVEFTHSANGNKYDAFQVGNNCKLTIIDSTIKSENGDTSSVFLSGNQSQTNIINSTLISNTYGITSNASGDESWDVIANVNNSKIITKNGSGVLLNVPGQYTFTKSTIEGNRIGVAIRGGDAIFENCTITETGDNTNARDDGLSAEFSKSPVAGTAYANQGMWADGDGIQFGALIVGDWAVSYDYNASVKLVSTSVYMNDIWTELPIVYLSQDSGNITTFTYDDSCKFYKKEESFTSDKAIVENSAPAIDGVLDKGTISKHKI